MSHPAFADVRVRLNRAKANTERLKAEIATFRRDYPDAYSIGLKHNSKGKAALVARIKRRPPAEWGLACGDILVDVRCALDYAVYALARAYARNHRPPHASDLQFPVCKTDRSWKGAINRHRLYGLPKRAVDYIESVQPYQPGNGGDTAALLALEELVGINKHRFIYVTYPRLADTQIPVEMINARVEDVDIRKIPGELKDGSILATFRVIATAKHARVNLHTNLSTQIVMEPTEKGWLDLVHTLVGLRLTAELYVGELEATLPAA